MKKSSTKLQLKANTIRILQGEELAQVHGGDPGPGNGGPKPRGPTADCPTQQQQGCSHPPQHTPGSTH